MWWSCHSREQGIVRRRAGKITERKLSWNQRGLALILDICSIRGGITKLGRSANVLVGLAVVGVFLQPKPDERREDRQSQTTAIIVSDRCNCPRFDIFGKPLGFLFAGGDGGEFAFSEQGQAGMLEFGNFVGICGAGYDF